MPEGKRCGSARMFPSLSRPTCQQSSIMTYWYPASFMPDFTIASVVCLMRSSLTLHSNLFQLFHPIGGVGASADSCANIGEAEVSSTTARKMVLTWCLLSCDYRARSSKCVIDDIQIANSGKNESVMNSQSIRYGTLDHRNNCAANDRHHQQARAFSGERAELRNPEGENTGKHDRIAKAHQKNAPHRDMAERQHGSTNQQTCGSRSDAQHGASANLLQNRRADKSAEHGASPIIRNVASRHQDGNISNIRLAEIVNQKTTNRHLGAHITKNPNRPQHQIAVFPYAGLQTGRTTAFRLRHCRQSEERNGDAEHKESQPNNNVRQLNRRGFVDAICLQCLGRQLPHALHAQWNRS